MRVVGQKKQRSRLAGEVAQGVFLFLGTAAGAYMLSVVGPSRAAVPMTLHAYLASVRQNCGGAPFLSCHCPSHRSVRHTWTSRMWSVFARSLQYYDSIVLYSRGV
jgi:hypothetical protein